MQTAYPSLVCIPTLLFKNSCLEAESLLQGWWWNESSELTCVLVFVLMLAGRLVRASEHLRFSRMIWGQNKALICCWTINTMSSFLSLNRGEKIMLSYWVLDVLGFEVSLIWNQIGFGTLLLAHLFFCFCFQAVIDPLITEWDPFPSVFLDFLWVRSRANS